VFITIDSAPSSGTYQVQVETTDRQTIDIGLCRIVGGKGSWGWTLGIPVRDISTIQLRRSGVPTMTADFTR
jgi:hypothetical protein